jgi:glycosyltransferase involved in cell wall biosynthesis
MKALALVDAPDHVCCRYRVRAFGPALEAAGVSLEIEGLAPSIARRTTQLFRCQGFDTVILQRKLLPAWQLAILRQRARRLIFDFDDAVLYRDSYDPRGPKSPRRGARFRRTVQAADLVVAGNDFLADCACQAGARPELVRVVPTCIDTRRYQPRVGSSPRDGLDLVWIGSSSTLQGIELQRSLWVRLGRQVPGLRFRVISDRYPTFEGTEVVRLPWSEAREARDLAEGDVGVSWVPDDLWSRGKCGLKILQYQAAGLPVVANPVGVHPRMVVPGETGFLPETTDDWVDAVRILATNVDRRLAMGRAAREFVESHYSISAWSGAVVAMFSGAAEPLVTAWKRQTGTIMERQSSA